ncbi:hypothetical protein CHS0354_011616 [Potamilus streckersoni]|uniref:Uncharacterized protein n=1 Tax=Potamilus streckersoni TaxID=2493646 RepID=A0AAE0TL49_9BIVA|nr:hypothetical protein CHS0354_011616 [Potamilus streckersoni]
MLPRALNLGCLGQQYFPHIHYEYFIGDQHNQHKFGTNSSFNLFYLDPNIQAIYGNQPHKKKQTLKVFKVTIALLLGSLVLQVTSVNKYDQPLINVRYFNYVNCNYLH